MLKSVWADPNWIKEGSWEERAKIAATLVEPDTSVLDIGCGKQTLRRMIPASCSYTPSDIVAWDETVIACDLDKDEFPAGRYDTIVVLGVLEFIRSPASVLSKCRASGQRLILSYNHRNWFSFWQRRKHRVTYIGRRRIIELLRNAGFETIHPRRLTKGTNFQTWLYDCG